MQHCGCGWVNYSQKYEPLILGTGQPWRCISISKILQTGDHELAWINYRWVKQVTYESPGMIVDTKSLWATVKTRNTVSIL